METQTRYRVLYAEDDQDTRLMVETLCGLSDIEVRTSATAAEAWELAQSEPFDLHLLDSQLADGDGLKLCRRLREHAAGKPILIYSGKAFQTDIQEGLAAGASDYLIKPYFDDLAVTIRQNIEKYARRFVFINIGWFINHRRNFCRSFVKTNRSDKS